MGIPRPAKRLASRSSALWSIRPRRGEIARGAREAARRRSGAGRGRGRGRAPGSGGPTRSRCGMPSGPEAEVGATSQARAAARPASAGDAPAPGPTRRKPEGRGAGRRGRGATSSGQSTPEAVVEAGQEPVRPDRAVGQVAEHAVRLRGRRAPGRAPAARSGRGCRTRAAGCRCGRGCAGTSSRRRRAPPRPVAAERAPARRPRGATTARPTTRTAAGSRKLSFVPAARPAARPATTSSGARSRPQPAAPHRARRARRPGVEGDRDRGEQEEDPDDVVARLPRLVRERRHAQGDRPERQRPGRHPVRPPMHQQANRQPTNQPRFSSGESRSRSNAFIPTAWRISAVRRVEPGQELRRDVVQVPGVAALEEPGRERPVVPGASRTRSSRCPAAGLTPRRSGRPPAAAMTRASRVATSSAPAGGSCRRMRGALRARAVLDPPHPPPPAGGASRCQRRQRRPQQIRQRLEQRRRSRGALRPRSGARGPAPTVAR